MLLQLYVGYTAEEITAPYMSADRSIIPQASNHVPACLAIEDALRFTL